MLALQAFTLNKPELIKEVAKWCYDYMQTDRMRTFFGQEGGWVSLH